MVSSLILITKENNSFLYRTTNDMGNIRYYSQEFQRNLEETDLNVFTDTFNLFLKYGTSAVKTFAGPAIDA